MIYFDRSKGVKEKKKAYVRPIDYNRYGDKDEER